MSCASIRPSPTAVSITSAPGRRQPSPGSTRAARCTTSGATRWRGGPTSLRGRSAPLADTGLRQRHWIANIRPDPLCDRRKHVEPQSIPDHPPLAPTLYEFGFLERLQMVFEVLALQAAPPEVQKLTGAEWPLQAEAPEHAEREFPAQRFEDALRSFRTCHRGRSPRVPANDIEGREHEVELLADQLSLDDRVHP